MKVKIFFAWYDFWIGWYWDRKKKILYICLLPMIVIQLKRKPREMFPNLDMWIYNLKNK